MAERPKRRRYKDNPYTLIYIEEKNTYMVSFKDVRGNLQQIEVSEEIYKTFDKFELQDIKELNEYDRHIEHSEIFENNINARAKDKPTSLEDEVINKTLIDEIKREINNLPAIQRERIKKYFFENKTYEEIARDEGVNKTSIMRAINNGLEKISKKIKN
ncbi:MAG: sigma-70 family RNA polymerase sigma factor [Clostridia bacterium]|nr:sigma-70 family RNA polymerase sigma factor [Clostridia bacterium]